MSSSERMMTKKKLEAERKEKQKKAYEKMIRRHKREMNKAAKNFNPWDWGYMHSMVVLMLTQFKEYYELGYNVFIEENEKNEIIKEINKALAYEEKYKNAYREYYKFINEKYHSDKLDVLSFIDRLNNIKLTEEDERESVELLKKCDKIETVAFEGFYKFLGKHMRRWWD